MDYVLVENKQTILLGPFTWNKYRFLQSELNDLEIDYTVSPAEPNSYLKITNEIEIYPCVITGLDYDGLYERLAGPFWSFDNDLASGYYTKYDRPVDEIKQDLKAIAASARYVKENSGPTTTIQGITVTLDTSRDNRNIFVQAFAMMADTATVDWKFPETWLTLTKAELGAAIMTGMQFIQAQFDWEKSIVDQIDVAQTVEQLKTIYDIISPPVVNQLGNNL